MLPTAGATPNRKPSQSQQAATLEVTLTLRVQWRRATISGSRAARQPQKFNNGRLVQPEVAAGNLSSRAGAYRNSGSHAPEWAFAWRPICIRRSLLPCRRLKIRRPHPRERAEHAPDRPLPAGPRSTNSAISARLGPARSRYGARQRGAWPSRDGAEVSHAPPTHTPGPSITSASKRMQIERRTRAGHH